MPLQVLFNDSKLKIGLWQIKENEVQFHEQLSHASAAVSVHPKRRVHWMAVRVALNALLKREVHVFHDTDGKPWLQNETGCISLSHSGNYAAVAYHPEVSVGIDLEELEPRLIHLAPKFVHNDEAAILETLGDLKGSGLIWSAKESLFKWYGKGQLNFKEHLRIILKDNVLSGIINKEHENIQIPLHYQFFDQYVITWTHIE